MQNGMLAEIPKFQQLRRKVGCGQTNAYFETGCEHRLSADWQTPEEMGFRRCCSYSSLVHMLPVVDIANHASLLMYM